MGLYATDGGLVDVGNVTVPSNDPVPVNGSLVEVRYLYGFPGGSLFGYVQNLVGSNLIIARFMTDPGLFLPPRSVLACPDSV